MQPYVNAKQISEKAATWLETIKPFDRDCPKLDRAKTALIVIDMQKFFLDPGSPTFTCGGLAIIPNLKALISSFRNAQCPVIYTKHVHHPGKLDAGIMGWWWEGMCLEGSPESEIHAELTPRATKR